MPHLTTQSVLNKSLIYIDITKKEFLMFNPPCKDCLVWSMCVDYSETKKYITIIFCDKIIKFINNSVNTDFYNLMLC